MWSVLKCDLAMVQYCESDNAVARCGAARRQCQGEYFNIFAGKLMKASREPVR